ncbi:hypothetical protein [Streptomyces montanisoli]|uniref:SseB family protein n=1 Tax=Streptomyces montanisoli TaxID=2798581 RepID=A0A940M978_9ACTN|nr:hypothetical protein [Streptomyces montanisoli]MBP0458610.1 hypothetical protein [Streptomyces montanisoli]
MPDQGDEAAQPQGGARVLRLADVAETAEPAAPAPTTPGPTAPEPTPAEPTTPEPTVEAHSAAARRRAFAELLGEFRRTAVLVPLGGGQAPDEERGVLTADFNGVRFILAFSDEQALARYAVARGEAAREWVYQSVLGARLLDVAVPAAGVPCGVALDCADGEGGMVFPPVRGIVPDAVAVDRPADEGGAA